MKRRSFLSWLLAAPAMPSVAAALPVPLPPVVPQAAAAIAPVVAAAPQLADAEAAIELRDWVDFSIKGRREYLELFDGVGYVSRIPIPVPTGSALFTFNTPQPELRMAFFSGLTRVFVFEGIRFRAHIEGMQHDLIPNRTTFRFGICSDCYADCGRLVRHEA